MVVDPESQIAGLFAGSSEAHGLARNVDWAATPLGPPEEWPAMLRNSVRLCMESPTPMAIWAGHEFTLIHNDAYAAILGGKATWAMGRPASEVWAEVWAQLEPEFVGVRDNGTSLRYENQPYVLRRHDRDEQTFFTYTLAPIEDGGQMLGLFNVCEETTLPMRELTRTQGKYQSLIEAMDVALCIVEVLFDGPRAHDYIFLEANPAFEKHAGEPAVFDKTAKQRLSDLDPQWLGFIERVALTGEPAWIEQYPATLDRFFEIRAFRIGEPEAHHVAVLFTDISERARAERALRESAERQSFLLRLSDQLRPLLDPAEIMQTATRALDEQLGTNRVMYAEIIDEDDAMIVYGHAVGVPPVTGRRSLHVLGDEAVEILRNGATLIINDVRDDPRFSPSTREFFLANDVTAAIGASLVKNGRWAASLVAHSTPPRQWTKSEVALLEEVAERTWSIAERAQQERRKSEFLAVLSHELRNPLAAIHNSLRLLERTEPGSERGLRAKAVLQRQTAHLTRLVDDLLDLTRISNGKVELQRQRVDLRELVSRTIDDIQPTFEQHGVTLRSEFEGSAVVVDADPVRLAQVLSNLLHNAVKFTPSGGTVTVLLSAAGDHATLRVRDSGEGISPGLRERLFEPFEQAEQGLARTRGGLGLGLALVRGLVELHGGQVQALSEGLGRGAEFVVTLPLLEPVQAAVEHPLAQADGEAGRDILLIDDNLDAAESLAGLLELEGHRVRVAANGRSGIDLAHELRPEIVLCDIGLPDISGYEIAKLLRADPAFGRTQLIALTGYAQAEDHRRAAEAGFDAHLSKPLSLERLDELLARP